MNSLVSQLVEKGLIRNDQLIGLAGPSTEITSLPYRRLMEAAGIAPGRFADLVAELHGLPRSDLDTMLGGEALLGPFSRVFLTESGLYPYRLRSGAQRLAVIDPTQRDVIAAVTMTLGGAVAIEIAGLDEIEIALERAGEAQEATVAGEDEPGPLTGAENVDELRDLASGAPVVRAVEEIFDRAVSLRATDIHIEPTRRDYQVRVRVDGVMRAIVAPRVPHRAIVSRIKILASLNIAEHRLPQDGRTRAKIRGRDYDIRVAVMPTTTGEAVILRLLDRSGKLVDFSQLGLRSRDETALRRQIEMPYGLVVVTGPTGSGKTTTLAAALSILNDQTRKILTVEDPVEYEIPGVSQSQVRTAVGLTFASALRAFLRQDPDVIMVGEVRDTETAKIAIQASLTGHMVMTTLHTNTAAAAITRLIDMGVEPFLIASSLRAVVGQRLVRLLCPDCRRPRRLEAPDFDLNPRFTAIGLDPGTVVHEPVGCERCGGTGYRGRRAIFEVLEVNEPIRRLILGGADDQAIETAARAAGMTTMIEDGRARCLDGTTSVDEVFRVAALR
ncbi:general secretion pathway protein GspE [Prosthecomicrobium hirschii]|uniref:GspE/PulE family protein n=1 Tax=Prosthecodimorpha hirschii TaxID=665126 RepID=UPI00112EEB2D|nr:ATPase, T2SS/T4P/T4SS family [Prosthecomicrobium hirschii]TPQ49841.1 general secretion pathway protein GspE [Prosthecomicrobium hirschii]